MARSHFERTQNDDGTWSLFWIVDGDIGGMLGDGADDPEPKVGVKHYSELHECWRANQAAKPFSSGIDLACKGFLFENEQTAKAAQKAADAAIRNKPIEEWEARALAAGWKPPASWKKAGAT